MGKDSDPPPAYGDPSDFGVPRPPPYSETGPSRQPRDESANERTSLLGQRNDRNEYASTSQPQTLSAYTASLVRENQNRHSYTHFPQPVLRQQRRKCSNTRRRFYTLIYASLFAGCVLWAVNYGFQNQVIRIPEPVKKVRVAVVGAGPAGVGVAWALGGEFAVAGGRGQVLGGVGVKRWGRERKVEVEITVFEKGMGVGGRMLLDLNGTSAFGVRGLGMQDLATGSLLSSSSVIRVTAEGAFGERWSAEAETRTKKVGFFDGNKTQATIARPVSRLSTWERLRLWWRYHSSLSQAQDLPTRPIEGIKRFMSLKGTFGGISEMVQKSGLTGAVARSAADTVQDAEIGGRYQEEVLRPQLMRQLGQELTEVSELALGAALWRENQAEAEVKSGRIEEALEMLLETSDAKVVLNTEVMGAKRRRTDAGFGDEKWDVKLTGQDQEVRYEVFDHVIVATQLAENLKEKLGVKDDGVSYRGIWVTLVLADGGLDTGAFGGGADEILPVSNLDVEWLNGIHEVSHVREVYGPDSHSTETSAQNTSTQAVHSLYRILSADSVPVATLARIFGSSKIHEVYQQKIEKAWPLVWPRGIGEVADMGGFEVAERVRGKGQEREGLWCLGGYEGVLEGMDVAWAVGENLGRLVARKIREGE